MSCFRGALHTCPTTYKILISSATFSQTTSQIIKILIYLLLFLKLIVNVKQVKLYPSTLFEPHWWFLSHPLRNKKDSFRSLKWWAGVDSNHRSLATADLQSAPFSHSGTYPYSILINLPLTGFEPVASPLPRECATPAPQRLKCHKG